MTNLLSRWSAKIWASIGSDIRSALVGAAVSFVGTFFWTWFFAENPPVSVEIHTTKDGYANPMPTLLDKVKEDTLPASFLFEPPELKSVWVCEYSLMQGRSGKEMMLAYLSKYSMCFSTIQRSENEYIVRPNPIGHDELRKTQQGWLCRC